MRDAGCRMSEMIQNARSGLDPLNRLSSAQGLRRAIETMISAEASSIELLRSLHAVQGAMRAVHQERCRAYLLDEHYGLRSQAAEQRVDAWHDGRMVVPHGRPEL